MPEVAVVAGTHDIPMSFVVNGVSAQSSLVGVTEGFQDIRSLVFFAAVISIKMI